MPAVKVIKSMIYEDAGASLMARVVGTNGSNIVQADISSISCAVFVNGTSVATPSITVSTVVFNTLQTDARWTLDTTGYNFRHDAAASVFSTGATAYRVEYKFTPASGEVFFVVFELTTLNVYTS